MAIGSRHAVRYVEAIRGRNDDVEFVWWRALMLFAVLFSMFCFTLELERLGKRLLGER